MHTFSCAVQSVAIGDLTLRFDADLGDYHLCRLYVGEYVVTFDRNGLVSAVDHVEPPADEAPAEEPAPDGSSLVEGDQADAPKEAAT